MGTNVTSSLKQGVTRVIQSLIDQHGGVHASQLVEAARPKSSAAHNAFEWDNGKAGDKYRLVQARQWLRVVRVRYEEREERLVHVPMQGREEDGNEGIYRTTSVVVATPDEFERALAEATATLHAARRAVEELRTAVELHPSPDRAAMIAQIARGLEIMQSALQMVH
ncbi:MAG: hypothetical protein ACREYC_14580 [Gammaproteobacteria bacterium]